VVPRLCVNWKKNIVYHSPRVCLFPLSRGSLTDADSSCLCSFVRCWFGIRKPDLARNLICLVCCICLDDEQTKLATGATILIRLRLSFPTNLVHVQPTGANELQHPNYRRVTMTRIGYVKRVTIIQFERSLTLYCLSRRARELASCLLLRWKVHPCLSALL
jgi:hypothetical protein